MASLTERQSRFVNEYIVDLNATQAAIRAGYSPRTASEQGARLLTNVNIKDAVAEKMAERSRRTGISQDRVLQELAYIAFDDIKNYLDFRTVKTPVGVDDVKGIVTEYQTIVDIKDSRTIDTRNVSEISTGKGGIFRFKQHDKLKALELLGKHLGMFRDKMELTGSLNNPFEGMTNKQLMELINDDG